MLNLWQSTSGSGTTRSRSLHLLVAGGLCAGAFALAGVGAGEAHGAGGVSIDRANSSRTLIPGERAVIQAKVIKGRHCRLVLSTSRGTRAMSPVRRAATTTARFVWRVPANVGNGRWAATVRCAPSRAAALRGKGVVARVVVKAQGTRVSRARAASGRISVGFPRPDVASLGGKGAPNRCKKILFIGVRGSGEKFMTGDQVAAMRDQLSRAPLVKDHVQREWIDYPAVPVSGWHIGVGADAALKIPAAYHRSVVAGKNILRARLMQNHSECPPNYVVLAGYSQGAQVAADIYQELVTTEAGGRFFGLVLFGDPYFNPTDPTGRGDFSQTKVLGHHVRGGILGRRAPHLAETNSAGRPVAVRSYCRKNDPICQSGPGGVNKNTHSQYNTGQAQDAGRWMSTLLRAQLNTDAAPPTTPDTGVVEAPGSGSTTMPNPTTPPVTAPPPVAPPAPPSPVPPPATTPPAARTYPQQQATRGVNTFTNPYNASGMGPRIEPRTWVEVTCKVYAPQIASANPDGYWYRIASAPWNNAYYSPANTFWNGDVEGQKPYTHNTDWNVPNC